MLLSQEVKRGISYDNIDIIISDFEPQSVKLLSEQLWLWTIIHSAVYSYYGKGNKYIELDFKKDFYVKQMHYLGRNKLIF